MSSLSTHVLDTAHGCPAEGVALELTDAADAVLFAGTTNAEGRCSGIPALDPGNYVLTFAVADYFRGKGAELPQPPFIDRIPLHFGIADSNGHYHVPLLISPFSYSTYRGS